MSVPGVYDVTFDTPMGSQQAVLTLKDEGGSLAGTFSGPMGAQDFSGGTIDGDSATWNVEVTTPMAMTLEFSATVDGDNIDGSIVLGSFGNATFNGTRQA